MDLLRSLLSKTCVNFSAELLCCVLLCISQMHSHPLSRSGRVVLHRGTAHIFRSIPSPTRAGRFSQNALMRMLCSFSSAGTSSISSAGTAIFIGQGSLVSSLGFAAHVRSFWSRCSRMAVAECDGGAATPSFQRYGAWPGWSDRNSACRRN